MAFFNADSTNLRSNFLTLIKFVFFLGLGILIIWLSIRNLTQTEKDEIINSFRTANYNWVVLAIFLGILSHVIRSLRWMIFFEPMGYHPSFKNTFYAVMVGYFANMAFPRLGEVTRCQVREDSFQQILRNGNHRKGIGYDHILPVISSDDLYPDRYPARLPG
jgi:MFS superfamily sulfate permease-like transporter